ncbi:unnamed protein product [Didymodactylos carnosus]|uniref:Uncharacterized protein n=1 Tax=Didymodactylos carnosus TaxID=1234261 RepID=A0A814XPQ3_9BILA|nr:unnamed protein product [Didymodactylos carnosus]CAF3982309.1 unnamed protein product [Didymodactylos carnosus]
MANLRVKPTRNGTELGVTSIMLRDFLDAIKFIDLNMNNWPSLYPSGVERCVTEVSLLCCKQNEEDTIYIAHYAVYNSSFGIEVDRCVMQLSKLDPFTRSMISYKMTDPFDHPFLDFLRNHLWRLHNPLE